jgi:preprotein translocase SecE subunit
VAKTRAQRKAERRRREAEQQAKGGQAAADESRAQHDTQVPESADVLEAELAEEGADLDELKGRPSKTKAPAPSRADVGRPDEGAAAGGGAAEAEAEAEPADRISRREQRRAERERKEAAKESERRRAPKEEQVEKQRGRVTGFILSCIAELKRVQWPDRETLIQASAITLIFIAVMAAYLGVLDAIFNWLVKLIL